MAGRRCDSFYIVNRNPVALTGRQIELAAKPGQRYFDVWHGVELKPEEAGTRVSLSIEMEAMGYGAVLATSHPDAALQKLLGEMHALSARKLADFPDVWKPLLQTIFEISATEAASSAPAE